MCDATDVPVVSQVLPHVRLSTRMYCDRVAAAKLEDLCEGTSDVEARTGVVVGLFEHYRIVMHGRTPTPALQEAFCKTRLDIHGTGCMGTHFVVRYCGTQLWHHVRNLSEVRYITFDPNFSQQSAVPHHYESTNGAVVIALHRTTSL